MRVFFLLHLIPFGLAIVLSIVVLKGDIFFEYLFPKFGENIDIKVPQNTQGHYPNYATGIQSETDICYALNQGNAIVIFGSSELTSASVYKPFLFIPKEARYPTFAIGHAGNQTMSILTQLAAMGQYLPGANIVILVSPGWFEDREAKGTSVQKFLEYNSERFLNRIWFDTIISPKVKNRIYGYVSNNLSSISSPSSILKLMNYQYLSDKNAINQAVYWPLIQLNERFVLRKRATYEKLYAANYIPATLELPQVNSTTETDLPARASHQLPWDSLFASSKNKSSQASTNNSWGIENEYYSAHINGKHGHIKPVTLENNEEYNDFQTLLLLLKNYKVNASLVIQPLNPFYYEELNKIEPLISQLESDIIRNGFNCLNLFTADTSHYDKALLADVMHLGDYGWHRTNKFILDNYTQ